MSTDGFPKRFARQVSALLRGDTNEDADVSDDILRDAELVLNAAPEYDIPLHTFQSSEWEAAQRCAARIRETVREDDGVDAESGYWLRDVGFESSSSGLGPRSIAMPGGMHLQRWTGVPAKFQIQTNHCIVPLASPAETRGDVRRLCAALGITLKEGT